MIPSFSPVHLRGSSPLYMQNLPKCSNPLSEKPDTPGGGSLGYKTISNHFCAFHVDTHKFWGHSLDLMLDFR